MKNYFYSLFIIILISSCKKEEEIILTAIELDKKEIAFTKYQDNPYVCDIKVVPKN